MSEDNVELLADYSDSSMHWSVEQMMENELFDIKTGDRSATKAVVIYLDDTSDEGYDLSYSNAQLRNSELVCMLETLKLNIVSKMGII